MSIDTLSRDEQLASVTWALDRMVALRKAGEEAWFRISWVTHSGRRVYRLEIRRASGVIERPLWPNPVGSKQCVEETRPSERTASADPAPVVVSEEISDQGRASRHESPGQGRQDS